VLAGEGEAAVGEAVEVALGVVADAGVPVAVEAAGAREEVPLAVAPASDAVSSGWR